MKQTEKYKYIICILVVVIIILGIVFYMFDTKNIETQQYLHRIYARMKKFDDKYQSIISNEKQIVSNGEIIYIENILNKDFHRFLKTHFLDMSSHKSRDLGLRKASGVNFIDLHKTDDFEGCLEVYYSNRVLDYVSEIVQKPVQRTPSSDINSCSLLIYSQEGDYIDWHKDNSNYYGDRYVVLYTIVNQNEKEDQLSENTFYYKLNDKEYKLKMKPNSLVIFKGSEIWHKSSAIKKNEKRVLLSMTFCDICQEKKNIIDYVHDKIKNFVIYG